MLADLNKNNIYYLLFGLFSVAFLFLIASSPFGIIGIYVLFALTFIFFVSFNISLTYFTFMLLCFTPYIYAFHQSIVFAIIVFFSAVINFKGISKSELQNSLTTPMCLYFCMALLSLINSAELLSSLLEMLNLLSLLMIFFATIIAIKSRDNMMRIFYTFIVFIFLHSIYVDFLGLTTGKRVFGILFVYYIDYAGLGAIVSFILFIYSKGFKKAIFGILFLIITLGLILTQTRNAWLSFTVAIIFLLGFLFLKSPKFYIKKTSVVFLLLVTFLALSIAYFTASNLNTDVGDRLDINTQSVQLDEKDPYNIGDNSFISRALIWHTAVMAFLEHPIIGIGSYSFMYTSQMYYKIPKAFYKLYVSGLKPHVTYLQVLTETGVVGFLFYMFFIFSIIKQILSSLKLVHASKEDVVLTLMITSSLVYIIFSMLMTDAWSYGPYICWFGVLLAFLTNNKKLLLSNK